jgi:membrane associated rhomboid family serine protease
MLWPVSSPFFQPHQLLTHLFLHGNFFHLLFNMFALWFFGCDVERKWEGKKFIFYYIFCGLGAAASQLIAGNLTGSLAPMLGASGAIFGVLLAYAMLFPNRRIGILALPTTIIIVSSLLPSSPLLNLLSQICTIVFIVLIFAMTNPQSSLAQWFGRNMSIMMPVYLKSKWIVAGYMCIEILYMYLQLPGDEIAHIAHLGGALFGLIPILIWEKQVFKNEPFKKKTFKNANTNKATGYGPTREDDMAYNARKKARQEEIDRILDKIRKSGYDSLTEKEKQWLFEASRES